jgi:hypothetical protein
MKVNEASLPDGGLGAKLELSEYNASVFDDANITQFTPVPNSGLPSVSYFSPLSAPTVTNIVTIATVPHFDVVCVVPATGRVTTMTLFYTTSASPTVTDWKVWGFDNATNSQPFTPSTNITFTNLTVPINTYYFAFKVGNEISVSSLSAISSSHNWSPNLITTVGTSPTISGTTMTGAGSVIVTSGNFAFGNSTTNISFDGTQMTLNGNVVATANVNANAVTVATGVALATDTTIAGTEITLLTISSFDTGGQPCSITFSSSILNGQSGPAVNSTFSYRLKFNGTTQQTITMFFSSSGSIIPASVTRQIYFASPPSSAFSITLTCQLTTGSDSAIVYAIDSGGTSMVVLGLKR